MATPWRVESATTREHLQAVLNTLDADGYYITFVLTASVRDPVAFTVVAKQRRLSGNSEAPAPPPSEPTTGPVLSSTGKRRTRRKTPPPAGA
jgi:hypothetical protein